MRMRSTCLFVLILTSLAIAGPFPPDDAMPQPTMPPLVIRQFLEVQRYGPSACLTPSPYCITVLLCS